MTALDQLAAWPVSNCAAAIVSRNGIEATTGDQHRRFALASLTKPLTALAALIAVEEGAIELDDPIADAPLLTELPGATLRHLLAHASGMAPDRRSRAAAAGTRRIYSNCGFDVIGELVAAATDLPFAQYLNEALLGPLRLTQTSLDGSPGSGASASVADYAAVLAELLSSSGLLDASTLTALRSVQFPGLPGVLPGYGGQDPNDWGLGFEIRANKNPHWTSSGNSAATYGHFGRSGTMFWIDPVARLGLVALSDRDFDEWAITAWPALSDAVLEEYAG